MKITYIGHSGFLIESEKCIFLFDYYETESNNGIFPDFNKSNPMFVFASHFHGDHYNPEIFTMFSDVSNINYILSKDIKKKPDIETITTVKANDEYSFKDNSDNEIKVITLKSTDSGVAYIVKYLGKTIYHAGDLNWWAWEDDTKQEANDMKAKFQREIKKLSETTQEIDAAFLPLDPRQDSLFHLGFDYTMKTANIKHAFPMHMNKDYTVIEKLKQLQTSSQYREKIINIKEENPYEI